MFYNLLILYVLFRNIVKEHCWTDATHKAGEIIHFQTSDFKFCLPLPLLWAVRVVLVHIKSIVINILVITKICAVKAHVFISPKHVFISPTHVFISPTYIMLNV